MNISPLCFKDFYKVDHIHQYPDNTSKIYSNLTARSSRDIDITHHVVFGIQYLIREYLMKQFNVGFFSQPKHEVLRRYKRRVDNALGKDAVDISHIGRLHDLGYLPIQIKALPEGSLCPISVPCMTITNTIDDFFWLPNFLETLISATLWPMINSATIAQKFRVMLDEYAHATSDMPEFVDWQGHDFSMRGMFGMEASVMSGMAHLLSFTGTDTIAAIDALEDYYLANSDYELIGGSVPATEHSVMCAGGQDNEQFTFKRLLTDVYPSGIVSVVSDSWDYWRVINEYLPGLKDHVMARDGKLVIRPDSGDPAQVILKTIPKLWEIFGGATNSKGFKQLDPHIGLIYGDGITYERAMDIMEGLQNLGFASTNVVLGLGSYTYQMNTRDTLGQAMKATYAVINGEPYEIFKAPKEDSTKRSAKGLLQVVWLDGDYHLREQVTEIEEQCSALRTVFRNGQPTEFVTLSTIRERLKLHTYRNSSPTPVDGTVAA